VVEALLVDYFLGDLPVPTKADRVWRGRCSSGGGQGNRFQRAAGKYLQPAERNWAASAAYFADRRFSSTWRGLIPPGLLS
jgi:hypothetical protein